MDAELKQAFDRIEDRFAHMDERFTQLEERLNMRIEETETRLLTAFHNWAQTYEVRARGTTNAVREFDERLGMVEERLSRLERSPRRPS